MRQLNALDNSARRRWRGRPAGGSFRARSFHGSPPGKYRELPNVLAHLNSIQINILDNVGPFKPETEEKAKQVPPKSEHRSRNTASMCWWIAANCRVRLVIVEMNPTYSNLFGSIDQEAVMGTLVTDFTLSYAVGHSTGQKGLSSCQRKT
jgi:hypothetical protein